MALSQRKRQRKLEKRRAKQRARQRPMATRSPQGVAGRVSEAADYPVLDCYVSASIWDMGLGDVLLSRCVPGGVAFGVFLVDCLCLGVKDAMANIVTRSEYQEQVLKGFGAETSLVAKPPAYARKLVEDAVQYARQHGLAPHPDYRVARKIFGDIDPEECDETFQFGRRGKPCFVSGPHDTPERCREIRSILEFECGPDGYDFILAAPGPADLPLTLDDEEFDEG